ncbi:MAG: hypothetical protein K8T90_11840 [Planctomycetes bacterium]|nr:hypothetical protein [Planctomycetota bacterium]
MTRAAAIAARKPFRGRGTLIALPDSAGCLVTAVLAADELDLTGDDLVRELHEHTPFEPEVAALRFRLLRTDGRRREMLVAALPTAQDRRFRDAASPRGDPSIGFGFASASIVRGARALGVCEPASYVVELHPHVTHVYAIDDQRARRYLLPAGAVELVAAAAGALSRPVAAVRDAVASGAVDAATEAALAAAAEVLAHDIQDVARYHVVQRYVPNDPPENLPTPKFHGAGPLLDRGPLRRALAAHLGAAFASGAPLAEAPGETRPRIVWDAAPAERMAALAGAVGAALEAFQPRDAQLVLHALPADLPAVRDRSPWPLAAAIAVVAAAAGGWLYVTRPESPVTEAGPGRQAALTVPPAVDEASRAVALIDVADAVAELIGDGFAPTRVEVTWTGAGYRVACDATGAALRSPRLARLAPRVQDESWTQGDGSADSIAYSGRWFAPAPARPTELDADAAKHLDTALGAWRAARSDAARRGRDEVRAPGLVALLATSDAGARIVAQCEPDGTQASATRTDTIDTDVRSEPEPPAARDGAEFVSDVAPRLRSALVATPVASSALALGTAPSDLGGVVLTWSDGDARRLQSRTASEPWTDTMEVPPGPGVWSAPAEQITPPRRWRLTLDTPGGSSYAGIPRYVRPVALAVIAEIAPPSGTHVRIVLRGAGSAAGLSAEGEITLGDEASLPLDAPAPGTSPTLDAGVRIQAVRVLQTLETTTVRAPTFRPDGRVERDADGNALWAERREPRPIRVLEADLVHPSGKVETVSRKMTDG